MKIVKFLSTMAIIYLSVGYIKSMETNCDEGQNLHISNNEDDFMLKIIGSPSQMSGSGKTTVDTDKVSQEVEQLKSKVQQLENKLENMVCSIANSKQSQNQKIINPEDNKENIYNNIENNLQECSTNIVQKQKIIFHKQSKTKTSWLNSYRIFKQEEPSKKFNATKEQYDYNPFFNPL